MADDRKLQYARIDTDLASGSKALSIRKKFGILGHAMIYEVIAWITAKDGWFMEWNDNTADDFAMTRMYDLSLSDKVREILLSMVEVGFFSPSAFKKYKVLTSPKLYTFWADTKRKYAIKSRKKEGAQEYLAQLVPGGTKDREILELLLAEDPGHFAKGDNPKCIPQNTDSAPQNTDEPAQNTDEPAQNTDFFRQRKEKKSKVLNKQTNKQTSAEDFRDETPAESAQIPPDCGILPADPEPKRRREELPAGAREPSTPHRATSGSERPASWPGEESPAGAPGPDCGILPQRVAEVRLKIVRAIYEVGLSADLVDAMTHAAMNRWINVPQVEAWRRKARDETELYRTSKGRAGKAKAWAVYRPLLEAVYLAHGATLPPCSAKRKEPPPVPADAGEDGATDAGRKVR